MFFTDISTIRSHMILDNYGKKTLLHFSYILLYFCSLLVGDPIHNNIMVSSLLPWLLVWPCYMITDQFLANFMSLGNPESVLAKSVSKSGPTWARTALYEQMRSCWHIAVRDALHLYSISHQNTLWIVRHCEIRCIINLFTKVSRATSHSQAEILQLPQEEWDFGILYTAIY